MVRIPRRVRWPLLLAILALPVAVVAWRDTLAEPIVRTATISLPGYPRDAPPLRVLLMSDLHVGGPDMPPSRLERIVALANRQQPDIVVVAGDLPSTKRIGWSYPMRAIVAPLGRLTPRIGTIAVLGNHDHWRNPLLAMTELERIGATVIVDDAVRVGGITWGGLDDEFTAPDNVSQTFARMRWLGPPYALLSHGPNRVRRLPPDVSLMLAGHTHCGQLDLPLIGPPSTFVRHGHRSPIACGLIRKGARTLVVSAGLGTSVLPFRFGTRPDMWLLTIVPETKKAPGANRGPS